MTTEPVPSSVRPSLAYETGRVEDAMAARVASLQARALESVRRALGPDLGRPYALLDFPCFSNVGDNAIWLGTLAALEALGLPAPSYTCDNRTFEPETLTRCVGDGPLLLLGGGNFGDLFGKHQRLRERVVAAFPKSRIVQLPQTIHFADAKAREGARRAFGQHPRLHVLVRDEPSLATATRDLGLDASLCPDLAVTLPRATDASSRSVTTSRPPIVWIGRGDAWRLHPAPLGEPDVFASDWPRERPSVLRVRLRFLSSLIRRRLTFGLPLRPALSRTYEPLARWRLARALEHVARGRVIVTDRLHGHLLAMEEGLPHVLLDDRTGKVGAYHEAWTRGIDGIAFAKSPAMALGMARAFVASTGSSAGDRL